MEQSDQNQINQEAEIIEQANNETLEKIAFYLLSPVLIPLALASTALVCMYSVLRFVFVDPFRKTFSNDLDLDGVMNLLRVFVLMAYTCQNLICAPFYLLGQILASPVLVFAWIKSAFIEQAKNEALKKIAFYFLSPVLIPLALASTAFVCMSSVLRFVFVDPFRKAFSNDLNLNGVMNLLRVFVLMAYTCKNLICAPFYLLGQILASPVLVFAWIKSAFVGFVQLADFVCSAGKDKEIIGASNRLDEIEPAETRRCVSRCGYLLDRVWPKSDPNLTIGTCLPTSYDGTIVKTKSKAISGYISGIYDFDVNLGGDIDSPCCAVILDGEEKDRGSEEMGFRVAGRKWM